MYCDDRANCDNYNEQLKRNRQVARFTSSVATSLLKIHLIGRLEPCVIHSNSERWSWFPEFWANSLPSYMHCWTHPWTRRWSFFFCAQGFFFFCCCSRSFSWQNGCNPSHRLLGWHNIFPFHTHLRSMSWGQGWWWWGGMRSGNPRHRSPKHSPP